jgi:hypothetical protein
MSLVPTAITNLRALCSRTYIALKVELRRRLSGVPSSHLSEAIAAGFGFRTNAGLRAAIRESTGQMLTLQHIGRTHLPESMSLSTTQFSMYSG